MGSHHTLNGLKLWVQDSGPETDKKGTVLLFHGFPDTSDVWSPQVQALNAAGYRTITPDLPGLGQSDKPTDLAHYNMQTSVTPAMMALLDALGLKKVTVVGHDFGSGLAWGLAFTCPDRVERLVAVSIGFPGNYFSADPLRQREVSWYIPFILMPGSEEMLMANDWELLRLWAGQDASKEQLEAYIKRLSEPGNFTAGLNLYRGNFNAQVMGNNTPVVPPFKLSMPVLAVHPEQDSYCLEPQIKASKDVVAEGCWQHKVVPGGHWFFVQEPDVLNKLLLDFLGGV